MGNEYKRAKLQQPISTATLEPDRFKPEDRENKEMRRSPLKCEICDTEFNELFNLNKHTRNIHGVKILKCDICSYTTNDPFNYQRHKEGCIKRKRKKEEHEQDRKRAKVD